MQIKEEAGNLPTGLRQTDAIRDKKQRGDHLKVSEAGSFYV